MCWKELLPFRVDTWKLKPRLKRLLEKREILFWSRDFAMQYQLNSLLLLTGVNKIVPQATVI